MLLTHRERKKEICHPPRSSTTAARRRDVRTRGRYANEEGNGMESSRRKGGGELLGDTKRREREREGYKCDGVVGIRAATT
jgi:hypothetical protein